jgi:hypothetical protein
VKQRIVELNIVLMKNGVINVTLRLYASLQNKCPIVTAIYMGESDTYFEEEHTYYMLCIFDLFSLANLSTIVLIS